MTKAPTAALIASALCVAAPASADDVIIPDGQVICALDDVTGLAAGTLFSPNPVDHGYADRPVLMTPPPASDRSGPDPRDGLIFWTVAADQGNGWISEAHVYDTRQRIWHLTYSYFSAAQIPTTIGITRVCADPADLFDD